MAKLIPKEVKNLVLVLFMLAILICLLFFIITFSSLKVNIVNLNIKSKLGAQTKINYNIKVGIYFYKLPVFIINFNNEKPNKKIAIFNNKNMKIKLDTLEYLKKLQPKVKSMNLNLDIGTEEALYTAYLVTILNMAISILLPNISFLKDANKLHYKINPLYSRGNIAELKLQSIIYVKMTIYC